MNVRTFFTRVALIVQAGLIILMFAGTFLALLKPDLIRVAIDWVGSHIVSWGDWNYLIIGVTAIAESFPFVGAALPGMNIMILVGGFFVAHNWDIFPLAVTIAMVGACIGNALGFFLGRYCGKSFLEKYGIWFGVGPRELTWLESIIHKNGFWFLFGAKFHNLLRSFIPYLAGAHHFSGAKFWLANVLGSLVWSLAILLLGIFAVENYEIILKYVNYVILGLIVVAIGVYSYRKKNH